MSTQELITQYFDSVNNHDWDQLAEIFHPEVTVKHGMSLTSEGSERAIKLLNAVVRQFAAHADIPQRTLIDGNTAAIEIRFEGTLPDGKAVEFDAVDFIDTNGSQITKVVSWYDTAAVTSLIKG